MSESSGPEPIDIVRVTTRLNVGGIARHVSWLTAGLTGYRTLLVSGVVPPGEDDMSYFARELGVEPYLLAEMSREISFRDLLTVWKLYRVLTKVKPRLIHTHAAKAGAVGRVAGFLYRWLTPGTLVGKPRPCRFVHTYHGHVFHSYYGKFKTWVFLTIERTLARWATDRIVVISNQQFHEIHETYRVGRAGQFKIIPLGLDLSAYSNWRDQRRLLRAELGVGEGELLIGIVGRLTEIKNHALFLRIVAEWKRTVGARIAARFVVVGDGHLRGDLERQARELELGDKVIFLGNRTDPQVFYPGLDIVALTSLNEGTPLTLIEGMANARPVIATDVGGVIDLLGDMDGADAEVGYTQRQRGILVRPGDVEAFCRGLMNLAENKSLQDCLGQRGLEFVESSYSKDRLLRDVAGLYGELIGKDGRNTERGSRTGGEVCVS